MKNNKDYFDLYSPMGDYAPRNGSDYPHYDNTPVWKLIVGYTAFYTLLAVGLVAGGLFVLSFVETYIEMM